jgi:hypothetical protein
LIIEVYKNNAYYQKGIIERFAQLCRKYRKDLETFLPKIEEEYLQTDITEIQKVISRLRQLK